MDQWIFKAYLALPLCTDLLKTINLLNTDSPGFFKTHLYVAITFLKKNLFKLFI